MKDKHDKLAETGLPFVTVKFAQTLDGRIATTTGDSRWISGPGALKFAHKLRMEHDAIMVGIGTVLADDPRLTVRLIEGRDPLRVVVDSRLRIPLTAQVLKSAVVSNTIIATTDAADARRVERLRRHGATVLVLPSGKNPVGVDLKKLLRQLGKRRIGSILVEGGSGIITSLLAARLVDRLVVVTAPRILGRGIEAIGDLGITRLSNAIRFTSVKTQRIGPDIVFDGRIG